MFIALAEKYGFEAGGQNWSNTKYNALYQALLPALKRWDQRVKSEKRQEEEQLRAQARKKIIIRMIIVSVAGLVISFFAAPYLKAHMEKLTLNQYLVDRYPDSGISGLKKQEQKGSVYEFQVSAFPGEIFYAELAEGADLNSTDKDDFSDDLGKRLTREAGSKYGLACSAERISGRYKYDGGDSLIAYYSSGEDWEQFSDKLLKFVGSEDFRQLSFLEQVTVCPLTAHFPERVFKGGEDGLLTPKIWRADELPGKEALVKEVRDQYIQYMYSYEPWNLTEEEAAVYGPVYTSAAQNAGRIFRESHSFTNGQNPEDIIDDIENQTGNYIYWYRTERYYENIEYASPVSVMTIGNAYRLLEAAGIPIGITEDRSGFIVEKQGKTYCFGRAGQKERVSCYDIVKLMK